MYKAINNKFIVYGFFMWPIDLAIECNFVKIEDIEFDITKIIPEPIFDLLEEYYFPESEYQPQAKVQLENEEGSILDLLEQSESPQPTLTNQSQGSYNSKHRLDFKQVFKRFVEFFKSKQRKRRTHDTE
jgi:hypothetical protein